MAKTKSTPADTAPEQSQVELQPAGEPETVVQVADPAARTEQQEQEQELEYIEVRVLRDEPAYKLRCGQVVLLDVVTAAQLQASGGVDIEPAAVEAARGDAPVSTTDVIEADD